MIAKVICEAVDWVVGIGLLIAAWVCASGALMGWRMAGLVTWNWARMAAFLASLGICVLVAVTHL